MRKAAFLFCGLLSASLLQGCLHPTVSKRITIAKDLGRKNNMTESQMQAPPFLLTTWQRIGKPGQSARVYIEGDGLAWLSRYSPSRNPTPVYPLALALAAEDDSANVIYLARPCQFTGLIEDSSCPEKYWTTARTAPEVIAAFQNALDQIKVNHNITSFDLIGYSGGASVAALIAAGRADALSLRTVAGNISYAAFTHLHNVSALRDSIAPESEAKKLSLLPQIHFVGKKDDVVPNDIFLDWQTRSYPSACVQSFTVDADHHQGWTEAWPALLQKQPSCQGKTE